MSAAKIIISIFIIIMEKEADEVVKTAGVDQEDVDSYS